MTVEDMINKAVREGREIRFRIEEGYGLDLPAETPEIETYIEGHFEGRAFPDGDVCIDRFVPDNGEPFETFDVFPRLDEEAEEIPSMQVREDM